MAQFRERPAVIEAVCFVGIRDGEPKFAEPRPNWLNEALAKHHTELGSVSEGINGGLSVLTPEGDRDVRPGDFIVRAANDGLSPCTAGDFAARYESADG